MVEDMSLTTRTAGRREPRRYIITQEELIAHPSEAIGRIKLLVRIAGTCHCPVRLPSGVGSIPSVAARKSLKNGGPYRVLHEHNQAARNVDKRDHDLSMPELLKDDPELLAVVEGRKNPSDYQG